MDKRIWNPLPQHITIRLVENPEGGFTAFCPGLRGAVSEGSTEEEAEENLKDAMRELWRCNEDGFDGWFAAMEQADDSLKEFLRYTQG